MAIEVYSSADMGQSAYARVLLTGKPKTSGKTVLIGKTAPPRVLFINCDGRDAQFPARRYGAPEFDAIDVSTAEEFDEACRYAITKCEEGVYTTVALDTLT